MIEPVKKLLKETTLYKRRLRRKQLALFNEWTQEDESRMRMYRQFIAPGDLVFDVGANMGNRTKVFLKLGARVVGFEPQDSCGQFLADALADTPDFTLVRQALGREEGDKQMLISDAHVISTLSAEWVKKTTESGRFSAYRWNKTQQVSITTLDKMIQQFGQPRFVKVDVEGFEIEVLSGLTQPLDYMSIEFAAETLDKTLACIDHMQQLKADVSCQFSSDESMGFELDDWVSAEKMADSLRALVATDPIAWGDVYFDCTET